MLARQGCSIFTVEIQIEHIFRLVSGVYSEVPIGRVPIEARNYLGCVTSAVYLTDLTAQKILQKHGRKVRLAEFQTIPAALERGLWISDTSRGDTLCCSVWYWDQVRELRFIAGVKTTKSRHRLLLTTFHIGGKRQVKSLLRKGKILRNHAQ